MIYEQIPPKGSSEILLVCDHAGNEIPEGLDLGIGADELSKHIAFDIGAAGLTRALARGLGAAAILNPVSRLVIDVNRGLGDPTLVADSSDGLTIPGNCGLKLAELSQRIRTYYFPYHLAISTYLSQAPAETAVLAIHSFTPRLKDAELRPWHIGVVWQDDDRIARPLLNLLRTQADWVVGDNEPYKGHLEGDTLSQHALSKGRPHVLLEIRQDLIDTPERQRLFANRLTPLLRACVLS